MSLKFKATPQCFVLHLLDQTGVKIGVLKFPKNNLPDKLWVTKKLMVDFYSAPPSIQLTVATKKTTKEKKAHHSLVVVLY